VATASTLYALMQAVQAAVVALELTTGSPPVAIPVNLRKTAQFEQGLDPTLPIFVVCPSRTPKTSRPFDSEGQQDVAYPVDCVFISATNFDFVGTNTLDVFCSWEERIQKQFQNQPLAAVPTIIDCRVRPWVAMDPNKLKQGYDYSGLTLAFRSIESRT
jgi:hypothetical protein